MDKKNNTISKGFLTGFKNKKLIVFFAVGIVLIIGFAIVTATGGFFGISAPSSSSGSTGNTLVGFWTLAESDLYDTDIFQDMSGNGNNGTSANTPVYASDQAGTPNQAMTFNGSSDYVTIGNVGSIKSFSTWIYPTADTKSIADFDGGTTSIEIDGSNNITATGWTSPTIYVNGIASDDITLNTWNFITITSDTNVNASALVLGKETSYYTGNYSDIAIYSSALTDEQVSQLYKAGRTTAKIKIDASSLWDLPASTFESGTYHWAVRGNNIIANVGNTLEITYDDNQEGAYDFLSDVSDLSSDLVIGNKYKLTFDAKYTGGASGTLLEAYCSGILAQTGEITTTLTKYALDFTANSMASVWFGMRGMSAGNVVTIDNIELVDITNAVTPKLQKGLILDMPLNDRYTEAGSDLVISNCVNVNYDTFDGVSADGFHAISDGSGVHYGGTADEIVFVAGHNYYISFDIILTSGSSPIIQSKIGLGQSSLFTMFTEGEITSSGSYNYKWTESSSYTGVIQFWNDNNAAEYTISNLVVKELDGTTKDRTPLSNDGTVEGATLVYDGLVNAGDGIAYINQDKAYGTFEWDFNKGGADNDILINFIDNTGGTLDNYLGYAFRFYNDESILLNKVGIGWRSTLLRTAASYITINTDYRIKITRSLAGVFTVYIKGGTFGWDTWTTVVADSGTNPVTDNTYTTSNYLVADIDSGDTISNLKIDGKRISLANAVQSTGTWTLTGDAYSFITDDYISIDDTDDLSFGDGTDDSAFSMSSWVYIDDATNFNIVSKGIYNTDGEWRFYSGADDKVYFQFYDESVADCYVGRMFNTALTEGQWVSLIATYSGDSTSDSNSFFQDGIKIYLNGNRVDNTNVEAGVYVAMENLDHDVWLGRYNTDYTNGQIRDIKVYNRVLNSQEIQSLSENWTDCPSDMVWVDYAWTWLSTTWSNRGGFCIDKYEASNGGGSYYVDMNGDGDILDTAVDVYGDGTVFNETTPTAKAVSEYNANPWISINQVNAKAACMAAGKHLATNYEALLAAKGTPDPHTSVPATGTESCQIWNTGAWPDYSGKKPDGAEWSTSPAGTNSIKTGTAALCVSDAGAYDLIGNVWEWTDNVINGGLHPVTGAALPAQNYITGLDVYGIPSSTGSATTDYNYDHFWINVDGYRGFIRGGAWYHGSNAGLFALSLSGAPSSAHSHIGFRCAR